MKFLLTFLLLITTLFSSSSNQNLKSKQFLSNDEQKWLSENKTIRMCANPIWAPIGFYNTETKQPEGISIDTIRLIEKKLNNNINFKYVHTLSWKDSQRFLKEKKCDFITLFRKNEKRAEYALFTKPYMNYKFAIITRNDRPFVRDFSDIANKTIVRKKGSGMIYKIKKLYPDAKIIETKDFLDSLQKVSKGEAYAAVATLPVLSYNAKRFGIYNVQIAGYTNMETNLSIGVRKDYPILHSILEKSLAQITQNEHKEIQDKWMSVYIKEVKSNNTIYLLLSTILFLIVIYFIYKNYQAKKRLEDLNNTLEEKVTKQTHDLVKLNDELKEKNKILNVLNNEMKEQVQKQLEEIRSKDNELLEQAKLVSMGEMIGNIAHQWRQPLSVISTGATGMMIQKQYGNLDDEEIDKICKTIDKNAQYLSKTIDDFKNFIKGDRILKEFELSHSVNSFLNLVEGSIKSNNIDIVLNLDDTITINGYENELMQCFINIFNNAKDAIKQTRLQYKYIFIETFIDQNNIVIKFRDNANGIPKDILPRIFEPYFTTKHAYQGTGLGLHMTYSLIVKGMNGTIEAKNVNYTYENREFTGAEFTISIPRSQELKDDS